ncbi:MAG: DUF302 domain-containing protein [Thiohalomonadales bacterium]
MWKWLLIYLSFVSQVNAQEYTTKTEDSAQNSSDNIKSDNDFIYNNTISETEQFRTQQKPMLYVKKIKSPLNTVYKKVFTSLDNNGYFVVFEPNIGRNLAHFEKRWGNDYNKNKLESIRSMVFCNGWYANKVSNADPNMLALCPLHITLIHKKGITSILFVRPGSVAVNSPAAEIANELEQDVIRSIEEALVK